MCKLGAVFGPDFVTVNPIASYAIADGSAIALGVTDNSPQHRHMPAIEFLQGYL